jgi:hypothetical protein
VGCRLSSASDHTVDVTKNYKLLGVKTCFDVSVETGKIACVVLVASRFLLYDPCSSKKLAGSDRSNLSRLMCRRKLGWSPQMTAKPGEFLETNEVPMGVYKIVSVDDMALSRGR